MRIILARNYKTRSHCKIYDAVRRLDTLIYVRIPFGLKLFSTSVQLLRHRRLEAPVVVRARPAVPWPPAKLEALQHTRPTPHRTCAVLQASVMK